MHKNKALGTFIDGTSKKKITVVSSGYVGHENAQINTMICWMGKIIVMHMWNTLLEYILSKITTLNCWTTMPKNATDKVIKIALFSAVYLFVYLQSTLSWLLFKNAFQGVFITFSSGVSWSVQNKKATTTEKSIRVLKTIYSEVVLLRVKWGVKNAFHVVFLYLALGDTAVIW